MINIPIVGNNFTECQKAIYFDFDYNSYPNVHASVLLANKVVIKDNIAIGETNSFKDLCVYSPQYNDNIFLSTECQI